MATDNKILDQGISDIVGALTDPIIVMPGGWGDTLPDWIKTAITLDRMVMNMKALKGDHPTGTDAEACAYLYTASLTAPMSHDWARIYLYLGTKVMEAKRGKDSGATMPADIRVDQLTQDQERELDRLKRWIYAKRVEARLQHDRTARREQKQKAKEELPVVQASFF